MTVQLIDGREVPLGGVRGVSVRRFLPTKGKSTIGAWCFLDHFGPEPQHPMVVLPHPHTALQTVTWPLSGSIEHRDSVGSQVLVRPGELNLMTAGAGVSHSEVEIDHGQEPLRGLQLWVALPDEAMQSAPAFEQHRELPVAEGNGWSATVLMGEFASTRSPATIFTDLVGAQLEIQPGRQTFQLRNDFEYGWLLLDGEVTVGDQPLTAVTESDSALLYTAPGATTVTVTAQQPSRLLLLGGVPFPSDLVMWWNFIGRSHDDIVTARAEWEAASQRFGWVAGHGSDRIPAPPLPTTRLVPRRR